MTTPLGRMPLGSLRPQAPSSGPAVHNPENTPSSGPTLHSPGTPNSNGPTLHNPLTSASSGPTVHSTGVATHCAYCGLQCAMTLTGSSAADLTVSPRRFPTNRGGLCQKGWTSAAVLESPDRLTQPLVRAADGALVPISWDEALDLVA